MQVWDRPRKGWVNRAGVGSSGSTEQGWSTEEGCSQLSMGEIDRAGVGSTKQGWGRPSRSGVD